jgi:oligopeptide transport system ATP-binding protein
VEYDASIEEDGQKRTMVEITPGHFVFAAESEIEGYKAKAASYK